MEAKTYKKLKEYSSLLKDKNIQNILEQVLKGYELGEMEVKEESLIIHLMEEDNIDKVTLEITKEKIIFKRENKKEIEIKTIKEGPVVDREYYEWRPSGIVIEQVKEEYDYSIFSKHEKKVTDLVSKRYILSTKTLSEALNEIDCMYEHNMRYFYRRIGHYEEEILPPDIVTTFETHMKHYVPFDGIRRITDTKYSTNTLLNGEDVSYIYDIVEGPDKLLRIYDLYNGTINDRNMTDLKSIRLGLLREEAFELKTVKGITERENEIISKSTIEPKSNYYGNICRMFMDEFSYYEAVPLDDRDALLKAIKHRPSATETAKRTVERMIGMPYEEFDALDLDEQHRIIEEKSGKKMIPDKTKYMDCVPVDRVEIIPSDEPSNEKKDNKPRQFFKTIFKK